MDLLREYAAKRDFSKTEEPPAVGGAVRAKARAKDLTFVVQEHHASHLHYDFRLELDGVLKSWAVPKGPSLDPSQKRLAVEVEDHPLAYASFEGKIPEKEYGAGDVYRWDAGTWEPLKDPREGLRKGRLEFELRGEKLRGKWLLVRGGRKSGSKNQWLLFKRHDAFARQGHVASVRPEGRRAASAKHTKPEKVPGRRPAREKPLSMPGFVEPQLAQLSAKAPSGEGWVHEVKLDGYRIQVHLEKGRARLFTRAGHDWSEKYPALVKAFAKLAAKQAILDGELVAVDEKGRSNFQELQNAMEAGDAGGLLYYAFDLLFVDGKDLRPLPLLERKARLRKLLKGAPATVLFSEHFETSAPEMLKASCRLELEGIISKRADAPYQSGRGANWLKSKCQQRQEFVIGGFTDGEGSRQGFGALLLGVSDGARGLRYVGKVGTGFTRASLNELREKLRPLEKKKAPFSNSPRGKGLHWVEPKLVAEVSFANWTNDAHLRAPVFHGLRKDKAASEVKREDARLPEEDPYRTLSNKTKVLYPKAGFTKLDVARYYEAVKEWLYPHAADRPLSLLRCPDGTGKECFFQKHWDGELPAGISEVTLKEGEKTRNGFVLGGMRGILPLVQKGSLELHARNSRVPESEYPDQIVMDFDPGPGISWKQVVEAAFDLREILDALGLISFVKVSGGKGLHVHIPIDPRYPVDAVKAFSKALGDEMGRRKPGRYTTVLAKKARGNKIFVDYLRNGSQSTAVLPYSLRARETPAVALPVEWTELKRIAGPDVFTAKEALKKITKRKRDPWQGYASLQQRLTMLEKKN